MIPAAFIQEWRATTPWPDPRHVEQDLIISRALCDIFNDPSLVERLAFRGGTAINKLLFAQPLRYSEDIDLVQVRAEPIGPTVDMIRRVLSWLGPCRRKAAGHSMHLVFAFAPEAEGTLEASAQRRGGLTREQAGMPIAVGGGGPSRPFSSATTGAAKRLAPVSLCA
jgi:hypothetical protein